MPAERFTRRERVRRRSEFAHAFDRGRRANGRFMTVLVVPNALGVPRLGIVASRKIGGAVKRNRAKRIVRNLFRRNKITAGLDVIVIPRPSLVDAPIAELEADYRTALQRHARPQP